MANRFLEVTFRTGKPLAAYLSLDRRPEDASTASKPLGEGFVADFAADGRLIGIEITAPSRFSLERLNALLAQFGQPPLSADDAAPLAA
jgi:hypothetical protein